ncbi:MAG: hypothetical protein J5J00_11490 [Deltaproteobacteria bacterium]|nr:hypothetical protein [Deltaproteobacteria bacterium]
MNPARISATSPRSYQPATASRPQTQRNPAPGGLNEFSERVLQRFEGLGAWSKRNLENGAVDALQYGLSMALQSADTRASLPEMGRTSQASGAVRIVAKAGAFLDSVSNIFSIASAFHTDRMNGDKLLKGTMIQTAKSAGQISVGYLAGTGAAAVAVGLGAPIAVPVIIGGVVGTGAAYLFGKAADYIASW